MFQANFGNLFSFFKKNKYYYYLVCSLFVGWLFVL